jgi:predicted transport protein
VFQIQAGHAKQVAPRPFSNERELQRFVEANLEELLGVRLVASEFTTGERHAGRIDTLGLDEAGNPVVIEYKWDRSDSVINQGLFYLDWLFDHRGDYELAAQKSLGADVHISWATPRLILIASSYTKFDTYAVNQRGASVELLRYQCYAKDVFVLERVGEPLDTKPPKVAREKPMPDGEYGLDFHRAKTSDDLWKAFLDLRQKLLALEGVKERADQKSQITYRTTRSFAALDFKRGFIRCLFKGDESIADPQHRTKDILSYGWGYRWVVDLRSRDDIDYIFGLLGAAYDHQT